MSSILVHVFTTLLVFLLSVFPFTLHFFFLISMLPLFFLFFLLLFFLTLSYLFLSIISYACLPPPHCAQPMPFYIACYDGFYYFTSQLLLSGCEYPSQTTHQFVSCLAITTSLCYFAITTSLCWLCHIPFPDKKSVVLFSCSLWHSHPDKGWAFSLTNSYGMHLVIPAHFSLFWVVCHSSKTFPPKKLEREPQNRLPPSPHHQTIPSLTSDPWPITLVLAGYKWMVPEPYACSTSM